MSNRIIYVQFTNPTAYPPLEHSSQILAQQGWEILFLGTKSRSANFSFSPHAAIQVKLLEYHEGGWRQKLHYCIFLIWILSWIIYWRPQWVYVSEALASPIPLLLTYFSRIRVIYHEHDTPDRNSKKSIFLRLILWNRRRLAQRAELCILPNQHRIKEFIQDTQTHRPVLLVWNCPRRDDVCTPRLPKANQFCSLWYHGTLQPARLPKNFLIAIAQLPANLKLLFAGYSTYSDPLYVQQLQQLASELGIADRIEYLGAPMSRYELLSISQMGDIGLGFFPPEDADTMVAASNKPFDYLASGMALIVLDHPAYKEMYVTPGYGLACNPDDVDSIVSVLRWFLDHPKETQDMGEKGRQRILEAWNYETQFQPVLDILNT